MHDICITLTCSVNCELESRPAPLAKRVQPEIAGDDALFVSGFARVGDLSEDGHGIVTRDRAARSLPREVLAIDESRDERVHPGRLLNRINRRDVGMIQGCEGLRLPLEPRQAFRVPQTPRTRS